MRLESWVFLAAIGFYVLTCSTADAEPYTLRFQNPSQVFAYTQLRTPWGIVAAPCAPLATCSVVIDVPIGKQTVTAEATAGGAWSATSNALAVLIPPPPSQCLAQAPCRFDADLDGTVSGTDFRAFVAAFGASWIPKP